MHRINRLYADSLLRQPRLNVPNSGSPQDLGQHWFPSINHSARRLDETLTVGRLVNRRRRLQINLLPFAFYDPLPNLGGSLALLVHGVGVIHLFQANRTLGAVRTLEAAVQAVVSHTAIAVAITRHLRDGLWNILGGLIGFARFAREFIG